MMKKMLSVFLVLFLFGSIRSSYVPRPAPAPPKPPAGDYRAGFLHFTQNQKQNSAVFKSLQKPILILSLCQVDYHTSFLLRINRTLENTGEGNMSLRVKAQIIPNRIGYSQISLTVAYLVTQPLVHMDYQIVNITTKDPYALVYTSSPPSNRTYHTLFVLGWSKFGNTRFVSSYGISQTQSNYVYVFVEYIESDPNLHWVEVAVVIIDFERHCEKASIEYLIQIQMADQNTVWENSIHNYRESLYYMVGITNFYRFDIGFFNFSVQTHQIVSVNQTHLYYGVAGLDLSRTYLFLENQKKAEQELQKANELAKSAAANSTSLTKSSLMLIFGYSHTIILVLLLLFGESK